MDGQVAPSTHFSTASLPAQEQFEAWRRAVSVIFDVDGIERGHPENFGADVTAYQLGGIVVATSDLDQQRYERPAKKARSDNIDHYIITLYRTGSYRGEAGKSAIEGNAGTVQVLDLARAMATHESAARLLSVFIPREAMTALIGDECDLHGRDLRAGTGPLLADYLETLAQRLPAISSEQADAVGQATCGMIAACLRPSPESIEGARSAIDATLLQRAKKYININLQQTLSPEIVWQEIGVSRRTLYRVFERLGGVHRYIQERRLAQIHAALSDVADRRTIADIAKHYGFDCHETFWRAFKRQYGVTPGDVRLGRISHAGLASWPVTSADVGFDDWIRHLHA